ncbi:EpsG family protein [Epilithonimonas sp. UC225_85]|uniref:EpsG family protein n=1 Tax=Epilithonimonas sp. UC225_85 TaxID=3350167 RepID=UPI0036D34040
MPSKFVSKFFNIVLIIFVFIFTLGITYTADWDMYYDFFKTENDETDYVFYKLSILFHSFHFTFKEFYQFHIIVITFLNYFLITRFTKNYFYVMLAYMVINYVHSVNQIRYYMGFPIFILGCYYLLYQKRTFLGILLLILSYLCHTALAVVLIVIPIYYFVPIKKYFNYISILAIITGVIIYYMFKAQLGVGIEHFGEYFKEENTSSIMGGIYNSVPNIIVTVYLYILTRQTLKRFPEYYNDRMFVFLYKICFFPVIFIIPSFFLLILGHRYVVSFYILWVAFFLYMVKDLNHKERLSKFILFSSILLLASFFYYVIPEYIDSKSGTIPELEEILESIKYLKDIIF